jgi:hypothetical protein
MTYLCRFAAVLWAKHTTAGQLPPKGIIGKKHM